MSSNSASRNYSVVEPHPHATTPYVHTSRGGAGNVIKTNSTSKYGSTSTSASHPSISSSNPPKTFISGRGGAGNIYHNSERAIFSFDEELERQMRQQDAMAPVYHVGRGGAGNMSYVDASMRRKNSETASARSTSSNESGADIATRSIRRTLGNGWAKVSERF